MSFFNQSSLPKYVVFWTKRAALRCTLPESLTVLLRLFCSASARKQQHDRVVHSILTRWRSMQSARCLQAWRDWCESEHVGKAQLIRKIFDLWRWYLAASRRHLVRQLR